ncbi:MAG TPA: GrpB family protein [Cellvibrio sp.]|nr:GrpB family protein [Cellvibrio sp.]
MYLHPYNNDCPKEYLKEEQAILSAYKGAIELHHIGSTAVEGLYAKDCIDILGVVADLKQASLNVSGLEKLGFEYKGSYGIDNREYFSKRSRKVHFHIFQTGNININQHLGFVRIMKSRPDLVIELNNLKTLLANKYPLDKDAYQNEKVFFYDQIHRML